MKKVLALLATGFEDLEALGTVAILRRAGLKVALVSLEGFSTVKGSHGIEVVTETSIQAVEDYDALFLPGGAGHRLIDEREEARSLIKNFMDRDKIVSAICAAPSILGKMGYLDGKHYTCYPGFEKYGRGGSYSEVGVVRDGNLITGAGVAYVQPFAIEIISALLGSDRAEEISKQILLT